MWIDENEAFAEKKSTCEIPLAELMPLMEERLNSGQAVRFSPKGISMLPMLRQGRDQVTLTALQGDPKKYDILLYRRGNGSFVLHRVVRIGRTYTCIGDNQFSFEKGIAREQILAVVTTFWRDGKAYSTKSFSYKMYCVFWHHSRLVRRLWRALKSCVKKILQ